MAQRDLIVSFLSSVPTSILPMYMRQPLQLVSPVTQAAGSRFPGGRAGYRQWLHQFADGAGNVVPGLFRAAGAQPGDTIGRVCVMGFSNGCIGVDETLRFNDSARIDTVLAFDGIHGNFVPGTKRLNGAMYKRFLNHAAHVLQENPDVDPNAPVMCITHSSIVPGKYPSTTETANFIWDLALTKAPEDLLTLDCDFDCAPVLWEEKLAALSWPEPKRVCSGVMKDSGGNAKCYFWRSFADGWYDRRIANNLFVLGWGERSGDKVTTRDPSGNADHIFQGRVVLPELLKEFTVKRWNADCGLVAAFADGAQVCVPGTGAIYGQGGGKKTDYFPTVPDGQAPAQPLPVPTAPAERFDPRSVLWFIGAAAAGYAGARYVGEKA